MESSKTHFEDTVHKVRWFFGNISPDFLYVIEYIFVRKQQFCAQIRQGRKEKRGRGGTGDGTRHDPDNFGTSQERELHKTANRLQLPAQKFPQYLDIIYACFLLCHWTVALTNINS